MTKFTITYQRKVQVRPYEMLDIGLTQEFDTQEDSHGMAFDRVASHVNIWIKTERERL